MIEWAREVNGKENTLDRSIPYRYYVILNAPSHELLFVLSWNSFNQFKYATLYLKLSWEW